ncbi:hypothetical protein [Tomitella gaofuii]|uniref:hypothetical protein n=1 Tax=Tomitella gaofuii TaxID=2760083 RepID=UPI0015F98E63|nr:hypothetical protein [Tomitella gaofuii]
MNLKRIAATSAAGLASVTLAVGAVGTAGAAGSLAGLGSSGALGSAGAPGTSCGTTVVTPDTPGLWSTPGDEHGPGFAEVEGAPLGTGALTLENNSQGTSFYRTVGAPLADLVDDSGTLTDIAYDYTATNEATPAASNTPALQLRVTGASTVDESGVHFATIVWSPAPSEGEWTTATPGDSDQFWVTRDIVDDAGEVVLARGAKTTLAQIVELNPDATLEQIGIQQTKENQSTDVAVDNFVFGCEVTDFELTGADAGGSLAGLFGSLGSLGN